MPRTERGRRTRRTILDAAAAEVLTRANRAEAKLPASVRAQGLEIQKSSRQRLGNIVLYEVLGWYGIPSFYDKLLPVPLRAVPVVPPVRWIEMLILSLAEKRTAFVPSVQVVPPLATVQETAVATSFFMTVKTVAPDVTPLNVTERP